MSNDEGRALKGGIKDERQGGTAGGTSMIDEDRREAKAGQPAGGTGVGAPSGGDPGGMGGVNAKGGTGTDRPPGGVSPVQADTDRD